MPIFTVLNYFTPDLTLHESVNLSYHSDRAAHSGFRAYVLSVKFLHT